MMITITTNNPLKHLFETRICPIHKSVAKDRHCVVKIIGQLCAKCSNMTSKYNCADPSLIDPFPQKYRGHLPDINLCEPLFLHSATCLLDLYANSFWYNIKDGKKSYICTCYILYHFEMIWSNRLNLLKHSTLRLMAKCHHKICMQEFPSGCCCVKYKIVNLFEMVNRFYRNAHKFANLARIKLKRQIYAAPSCYLNCELSDEDFKEGEYSENVCTKICTKYKNILAEFYHPDGNFIKKFRHTLNEHSYESVMSIYSNNEKLEYIAFRKFLMNKFPNVKELKFENQKLLYRINKHPNIQRYL